MLIGAITASVIVPVKPFCGATVIVVVPEVPVVKLRDETSTVTVTSCVLVTVTIMDLE